jgi:hypothetical protein
VDAEVFAPRSSAAQHYPKGWKTFTQAIKAGMVPSDFGFKRDNGEIVRFASRYRVAKAFQGVQLEGYGQTTIDGYSALVKVFLCWSAFEQFLEVLGINQRNFGALLQPYAPDEAIQQIKTADRNRSFYDFLYSRVNKTHQTELRNYFRDDLKNVTYLASAIRHIFVHGLLTPHANQTRPAKVVKIGTVISEFLLRVMDEEFHKRVCSRVASSD